MTGPAPIGSPESAEEALIWQARCRAQPPPDAEEMALRLEAVQAEQHRSGRYTQAAEANEERKAAGLPAARKPEYPVDGVAVNGPAESFVDEAPKSVPVTVRVADVEPELVEWLWPGRLPLGKLVVLDGDPGLGKSTVTTDLTARVTTGSPLPDGARLNGPAGVVLLSAEDGIADTISPRLRAAGADCARVYVLDSIRDPEGISRPPSLPVDIAHLAEVVTRTGAALVVVDPLSAFLGGQVDSYRDADVRRALHPLARMAEATGACVLVVRHLSKTGGTNALYRGGGSIGIIGAARAALLVAPDPSDESRRIMAMTKSNLAEMAPALAFRLVPEEMYGCTRVQWEGATTHRAADLLAIPDDDEAKSAQEEAVEVLRDALAAGPIAAKKARSLARDAGVSDRTLARAKKALGVRSIKVGKPGEAGQSWEWDLAKDATEPEECLLTTLATFDEVGTLRPPKAPTNIEDAHVNNVGIFGNPEHLRDDE